MLKKTWNVDQLPVYVYEDRPSMGKAAAKATVEAIQEVLKTKEEVNMIFAAAPSQNEMLEALLQENIDFTKIHAFHMDEYVGLGIAHAQSFATYLTDHLFGKKPFGSVNLIPAALSGEEACEAYGALLEKYPPDIVCMGVGENGHIAFNDPPVADFQDPKAVKVVELEEMCRMQQVHDGCFPTLEEVPKYAVTLTIPSLVSARYLICTVPAPTKANAIKDMLTGAIGEHCPATILRNHPQAKLFLDQDSAKWVL